MSESAQNFLAWFIILYGWTACVALVTFMVWRVCQPDFGARHKQCPKCGSIVRRFLDDQSGVTAVEYALVASLIAVVIIGAVGTTGTNLSSSFERAVKQASSDEFVTVCQRVPRWQF